MMDGVAWMEFIDAGSFALPTRTIIVVSSHSKARRDTVVYFDDFVRALAYFGSLTVQSVINEAYMTAYRLKRPTEITELNLLNRSNFSAEGVTFLYWENTNEKS